MVLENIVNALLENLMALMPFVIVKQYEKGVRYKFGKNPSELDPGFHWKLYLYHEIDKIIVVDDTIDLGVQSVITSDEKMVCFRVSFAYTVDDAVKHQCNVTDFETSISSLARRHLAKRVRAMTYADIVSDLSKLEKSLEGTMTTKFRDWGVRVFDVGFTDFAKVETQVRLFGDQMPDYHHE